MGVNLIVSFKVKAEKVAAFKEIMQGVKTGLPTVPGCQSVKVLSGIDDPLTFTLVEAWDSKEVHAKHIQGVVDSGQWQQIVAHLSAEPSSAYYTEM